VINVIVKNNKDNFRMVGSCWNWNVDTRVKSTWIIHSEVFEGHCTKLCVHTFDHYLGPLHRMKPEETIDFPIRKVWTRISRLYNSEASKYGGTMAIGQILLSIDPEGTPSTKLGPKMGMESRSLVRTLRTMQDEGLIKRVPCTDDKRVVYIHLTAKGKQMRDVSRDTVVQFNKAIQSRFTKKQLDSFRAVMSELDRILEEEQLF